MIGEYFLKPLKYIVEKLLDFMLKIKHAYIAVDKWYEEMEEIDKYIYRRKK